MATEQARDSGAMLHWKEDARDSGAVVLLENCFKVKKGV